ncbi:MAG: 5-(carboxyamino)imidazole ribonucleotide mutase [Syntrophaceae bacterium]|nr:MAG: 5-(carboxyamino)imidazole ribonucleotide mutase [Syntrophaceae bacterium]
MLQKLSIPHEVRVISAHRTPDVAQTFATGAEDRGLQVIIAAAEKAAHLAGVPMSTSDMGGLDSLLSMVQMPAGIPVGTVAIGEAGAKNAALLAVSILALSDIGLSNELKTFRQQMRTEVEAADAEISNMPN